jgi:hypothetical protein
MSNTEDIAFVSPSGEDPDELRHAFDETDRRIKRAFLASGEAVAQVNAVSEAVSQQIVSMNASFDAYKAEVNNQILAVNQSVTGLVTAAFTTNQEPGFASIPQETTGLTTDRCIAVRSGTPRSLTPLVFRKDVLSLDTPKAHTINVNINTGFPFWADSSTYIANVATNALKSEVYDVALRADYLIQLIRDEYIAMVAKLKQAGVLS